MTDPVITAIIQVEEALESLVIPNPPPLKPVPASDPMDPTYPAYSSWASNASVSSYQNGVPPTSGTGVLTAVTSVLGVLYQVDFIATLGRTVPDLITQLQGILVNIADKLGLVPVAQIPDAVDGITKFITALQKLPGAPDDLTKVNDILTQVAGYLTDIPTARIELYLIAQQIGVIKSAFAQ
jgi:hypothetical protein